MTMLIPKAALMLRFRIVPTVTILQQTGLRLDRFADGHRSAGESKRSNLRIRLSGRLAEDLGKV